MCLSRKYTVKEKKEFLNSLEGDWIEVYKWVTTLPFRSAHSWAAIGMHGPLPRKRCRFKGGLNICSKPEPPYIKIWDGGFDYKYAPYFHFYCYPTTSLNITCYVHKSKISTVGIQHCKKVIVAREGVFPRHPYVNLSDGERIKFGIPVEGVARCA